MAEKILTPQEGAKVERLERGIIRELLVELSREGMRIERRYDQDGATHYFVKDKQGMTTRHLVDATEIEATLRRRLEMQPREWTEQDIAERENDMPGDMLKKFLTSDEVEKKPRN